jgi:hypothetical protein
MDLKGVILGKDATGSVGRRNKKGKPNFMGKFVGNLSRDISIRLEERYQMGAVLRTMK